MGGLRGKIDEAIAFLQEKYMNLSYYYAEHDEYPAGAEDDADGYENAIEALMKSKEIIEMELVAAANFCRAAEIHKEVER